MKDVRICLQNRGSEWYEGSWKARNRGIWRWGKFSTRM